MSSIATLETTSNGLDTVAKFLRLVAAEGVTAEQFRLPIDDQTARRNLALFFKNGCKLIVKGPSMLVIDRAKLPSVEKFVGKGWGIVENDDRSVLLTEIDFSKAVFGCPLREGEQYIAGEEKLVREKEESTLIRLDFGVAMSLFHEKGQATLRWLHDTHGVTWMEFTGSVLRFSDGDRCFFFLCRGDDGSWHWSCRWLDSHRHAKDVSVRLAS